MKNINFLKLLLFILIAVTFWSCSQKNNKNEVSKNFEADLRNFMLEFTKETIVPAMVILVLFMNFIFQQKPEKLLFSLLMKGIPEIFLSEQHWTQFFKNTDNQNEIKQYMIE